MPTETIQTTYVRTDNGEIYVQKPDDNQWGFTIYSDDQSWEGGFGLGSGWTAVPASEVPDADRERLGWLLEDEV